MKLFTVTIKPVSGFGTPLMGDTLFGHFCWQAAYDPVLLNGGLEKWIARYGQEPFAIFSTAWPKCPDGNYALKRPALPLAALYPSRAGMEKRKLISERKELQKERWMILDSDLTIRWDSVKFVGDAFLTSLIRMSGNEVSSHTHGPESGSFISEFDQPHNSINRLTMTTGEGAFAPFTENSAHYFSGTELAVFVLIDERATGIDRIVAGMERIGRFGFGKNASTGLGRFRITCTPREHRLPETASANALYTLAPCVPQKGTFATSSFTPFVRFGKHGDVMVRSGNPFKAPVVMAAEGAVFFPAEGKVVTKPYIGTAVTNISKALPGAVAQGYAPCLPFRLENTP